MRIVRNRRGFTLVEVVVVAGIIAILAGVLVPLIFNQIDESKIAKAQGDMKSIQNSIMLFRRDTGVWPERTSLNIPGVTLLYSDSKSTNVPPIPVITSLGWNTTTPQKLSDHLKADTNGAYGPNWKGPYMNSTDPDPWGNAYIVNADQFSGTGPIWILSPGPDGVVQTSIDLTPGANNVCADTNNGGDDICLRLR